MYSRIPMPQLEYREEDMRYVFLCFPIVGAVIGAIEILWFAIYKKCGFSSVFFASAAAAIPIFITGGFHMDGFMDTTDALSSFENREKKLEILKDSHVGAFAVIWCCVYMLLNFGAYYEIGARLNMTQMSFIPLTYTLSRATSSIAAITFPSAAHNNAAKSSLAEVKKASAQRAVLAGLLICLVIIISAALAINQLIGAVMLLLCGSAFLYYYKMSQKQFGGTTGDLSGWYLQVSELVMLLAIACML